MLCTGAFAALAFAIYSFLLSRFLMGMMEPGLSLDITNKDFANYWTAARLTLAGAQHDLFTQAVYFEHLKATFADPLYPLHAWSYPPHSLLLWWPLGFFEYKAALMGFLVATFVLFLAATATFRRTFAPRADVTLLVLALIGYTLMMLTAAQNGFLTAAMLLFAMAWMKRRPVWAGFAFACLTIKPQLGILIPVLLVFDRNWAALRWSTIFTLLLVALSVQLFGFDSWRAYVCETLEYQHFAMTQWNAVFLKMMPTTFGSIRALGLPAELASAMQWPLSILSAAFVCWLLAKERDPLRRAFVVACGTFLITPYAFNYDMGVLCVVAATLCGSDSSLANGERLVMAAVAGLAVAVENLGESGLPVSPFILAAGLAAVAAGVRRASTASSELAGPSGRSNDGECKTAS